MADREGAEAVDGPWELRKPVRRRLRECCRYMAKTGSGLTGSGALVFSYVTLFEQPISDEVVLNLKIPCNRVIKALSY